MDNMSPSACSSFLLRVFACRSLFTRKTGYTIARIENRTRREICFSCLHGFTILQKGRVIRPPEPMCSNITTMSVIVTAGFFVLQCEPPVQKKTSTTWAERELVAKEGGTNDIRRVNPHHSSRLYVKSVFSTVPNPAKPKFTSKKRKEKRL